MSSRVPSIIKYNYTIPKELDNSVESELYVVEQDRYQWHSVGWTECSATCGGGEFRLFQELFTDLSLMKTF